MQHVKVASTYACQRCAGHVKLNRMDMRSQIKCWGDCQGNYVIVCRPAVAESPLMPHNCAGHVKLNRMDKRSQIKCLGDCRELLAKGASVLFFPEGTRSKDSKMAEFKKVPP